jgi:hypothetical protein
LEDVEEESGSNVDTKLEHRSVSPIHDNRSRVHEYASPLTEALSPHHNGFLEPSGHFDVVIVANNLDELALSDKQSDKYNNKSQALTERLIGDLRQSGYEPEPDPKVITTSKPVITSN